MNINFEYGFQPANIAEIESFENKYSISLPEDYKGFLLNYNGGKPQVRRFKTRDGKQTSSLMFLFPLIQEDKQNLISIFNEFNEKRKIPNNLLAIGNDPVENKICISLSGEDKGMVYYWSLDMEEDIDEVDFLPSYTHMSLVATSFTEFINNLFLLQN